MDDLANFWLLLVSALSWVRCWQMFTAMLGKV